jgi:hypothetical protein
VSNKIVGNSLPLWMELPKCLVISCHFKESWSANDLCRCDECPRMALLRISTWTLWFGKIYQNEDIATFIQINFQHQVIMRLSIMICEDNNNAEDHPRLFAIRAGPCERECVHASKSAYAWRFWTSFAFTLRCSDDSRDHRSYAIVSLGSARSASVIGQSCYGVNTSSYRPYSSDPCCCTGSGLRLMTCILIYKYLSKASHVL